MRKDSYLIVKLSLLKQNILSLKQKFPEKNILFMVKSNAYGHGDQSIVNYCVKENLIQNFGCASLGEAKKMRACVRGEYNLYVFSELDLESSYIDYIDLRILPVISTLRDLKLVLSKPELKNLPLVIKINTGMNRLGFDPHEWDEMISLIKSQSKNIYHLMTHFSDSGKSLTTESKTMKQYNVFKDVIKKLNDSGILIQHKSMSNSGAIEQSFVGDECDFIRPGLLLYGISTVDKNVQSWWQGQCISKLESHPVKYMSLKSGDEIGYNSVVLKNDVDLALLPIGYGDGVINRMTGVSVYYKNLKGMLVARVNMDLAYIMFDAKTLNFTDFFTPFIFWNHDPKTIIDFAQKSNTIPYEVLCGLSIRIPRIYELE